MPQTVKANTLSINLWAVFVQFVEGGDQLPKFFSYRRVRYVLCPRLPIAGDEYKDPMLVGLRRRAALNRVSNRRNGFGPKCATAFDGRLRPRERYPPIVEVKSTPRQRATIAITKSTVYSQQDHRFKRLLSSFDQLVDLDSRKVLGARLLFMEPHPSLAGTFKSRRNRTGLSINPAS